MSEKIAKRTLAENIYVGLGVAFLCCLIIQFLLAGLAIFEDATKWMAHKTFVHIFGYTIPVFMIICSFAGGFFGRVYKEVMIIFLLIFAMYLTANVGWRVGWIGAFHPVAGIFLLGISAVSVMKVLKRGKKTVDASITKAKKEKGLLTWILAGAAGGFVAGIILSNILGIMSFLLFDKPIGIKFLPFYLTVISGILVPIWMYKRQEAKR